MDGAQATAKAPEVKRARLFGELLVSKGLLSPEELEQVLDEQRKSGGRLGENLLRLERLNDEDVTLALAEHLSMEYIRLNDIDKIDLDIARMLPEGLAKRFCLVAVGEADDKVVIVMADPLDVIAIDTVTLKMKRQAKLAVSSPREIRRAIELIYHGSDVEEKQLRSLVEGEGEIEEDGIRGDILSEEEDGSADGFGDDGQDGVAFDFAGDHAGGAEDAGEESVEQQGRKGDIGHDLGVAAGFEREGGDAGIEHEQACRHPHEDAEDRLADGFDEGIGDDCEEFVTHGFLSVTGAAGGLATTNEAARCAAAELCASGARHTTIHTTGIRQGSGSRCSHWDGEVRRD